MKILLFIVLTLVTFFALAQRPKEISFISSDNITIYGYLYKVDKEATTIFLFL